MRVGPGGIGSVPAALGYSSAARARGRPGAPGGPELPDRKPAGRRNGETAVRTQMKLALVLAGAWVLFSGIIQPLLLGLGLASVLGVAWIKARADSRDREPVPFAIRIERFPGYLLWLSWEIVKSNVDVARRILSPSLPIAPSVRWLPASQRSELTRVSYANSITLTPGTLSINLEDGWVEVHALNEDSLDALERGEMNARACRLDREPAD